MTIEAVLWDFGGVILSSPFEAFAAYEVELGLPPDTIRTLNATNPDTNAWARFERNELDVPGFAAAFEDEAALAGFPTIDALDVLSRLHGELRPEMVEALRRVGERFRTACLTNNVVVDGPGDPHRREALAQVMGMFDVVIESSKVGVRKPDPRFYELACEALGVEPSACVFLDDLGINLKPAKAMGMTTIKVLNPDQALGELEAILGLALRDRD